MACFLRVRFIVALGFLSFSAATLHARPPYKKALADYFGPTLAKKLNDCATCHLPLPAGAKEDDGDRPHNVFGERLAKAKSELRKAGKGTDIADRLQFLADEDTDGDGVGNTLEILAGHFPGDPKDVATAAEVEIARKLLVALRQKKSEYPWKPFEIVKRPPLPVVKNPAWSKNPVDRFMAAEHEKQGLTPRPEAPRHVLIRRLYLDLIGLPPTPDEVAEFERECSALTTNNKGEANVPDFVWAKWVDRLLNSPHHGERWGRHWMDVWRYSDWAGYGAEVRDSQPHMWRWRDWIVESLNNDRPYDRMIVEMLAGDEVAPADPQVLRATGFLVRNWFKFNRDIWLDRAVEHTGKAFLGITLNCARCHDHFFDPLTQKEYYQFRAFFEPHDVRTDRVPGNPDPTKDGVVRVFDAKHAQPTFLYVRGDDKNPDKKNPLAPTVPAALGGIALDIAPLNLPADVAQPERQAWLIAETLKNHEAAVQSAQAALGKVDAASKDLAALDFDLAKTKLDALQAVLSVEKLEAANPKSPEWEKAALDTARLQREVKLLEVRRNVLVAQQAALKADAKTQPAAKKKAEEATAALKKLDEEAKKPVTTAYVKRITINHPATSTGRRLGLAKWIASNQNPLTARVAVNHMWLRHFGKPLVPNTFDFGANGKPATHPALLDWLAAEFMQPGAPAQAWSMKHIHRLLVTSVAYRMDSTVEASHVAKDPENRWLWRMNQRRMEAEIVRDSVLAASGQLDRTFAGPEIAEGLGMTTKRRSIYYRYAPEKMMEFMTLFDSANVTECYERTESVVPQQALAMANSTLVLSQARLLARDLMKKLNAPAGPANSAAFARLAFQQILGRLPTTEELSMCERFLAEQSTLLAGKGLAPFTAGAANAVAPAADPQLRARESLVHVLFNHNEFVTIR